MESVMDFLSLPQALALLFYPLTTSSGPDYLHQIGLETHPSEQGPHVCLLL